MGCGRTTTTTARARVQKPRHGWCRRYELGGVPKEQFHVISCGTGFHFPKGHHVGTALVSVIVPTRRRGGFWLPSKCTTSFPPDGQHLARLTMAGPQYESDSSGPNKIGTTRPTRYAGPGTAPNSTSPLTFDGLVSFISLVCLVGGTMVMGWKMDNGREIALF